VNTCYTGPASPLEAIVSNLTIVVDDSVIKQARVRALQDGTSLSAKVREFLAAYAEGAPKPAARDATKSLMRLMKEVRAEAKPEPLSSGAKPFKREALYEGNYRKRG
jgi:plasmid stability protein